MYRCDECGEVTEAGQKCLREVVKSRPVVYTETVEFEHNGETVSYEREIGRGHEIVKEAKLCPNCQSVVEKEIVL